MRSESAAPPAPRSELDSLGASTTAFVQGVEEHLKELFAARATAPAQGADPSEAARYTCLAARAKRVRPRLVGLFGRAVGAAESDLVDVAVAAELIHAASLVHDDVVDHGTVRRGRPTVNAQWDNVHAVLCGDLMFSISFRQLRSYPSELLISAVDVVREMSCAAIDEVQGRAQDDLPVAAWRAVAEGKAGSLFGWCGTAAAGLVNDAAAGARFDRCGRALGVAFQLADDLKDLIGSDGKDRFADIKNQNPSWPLLWARDHDPACARQLRAAWAAPSVPQDAVHALGEAVLISGAVAAAREAIRAEIAAGLDALGDYRHRPGTSELASWAEALVPSSGAQGVEDR